MSSVHNTNKNTHLLYNARIWQLTTLSPATGSSKTAASTDVLDEDEDLSWMLFDTKSGYILDVGSSDSTPLDTVPRTQQTDCAGQRVLPGLHDAHIHVAMFGRSLLSVDLFGCRSIEELQDRLRQFAVAHPEPRWIVGRGWEHDKLGRFPNRRDLDQVSPDRPVYLVRVCAHLGLVNTAALKLAGIDENTPDPPGGVIERDVTSSSPRQPTGILIENAMEIINPLVAPDIDTTCTYIESALETLLRHGVTSVCACENGTWKAFCRLADQGRLPLRVFYSAYYNETRHSTDGCFPAAVGDSRGQFLSCDRVKLFSDGALGVGTAALSLPYCNDACNHGMLIYSQEELTERVREATASGFRVEIHVIGDKAVDVALSALEDARVAPHKRPVLVHCQILRDDLINRMCKQGVIASIQPEFVPTDARWLSTYLQPQLMQFAYPWKTLLDRGIVCAGGSDAPIETPQPLVGIYDAIYRPAGERSVHSQQLFKPEECLAVRQAIELFTVGAAFAVKQEHELGQLLPGFKADFIILDIDICQQPQQLLNTKVLQVWVAGQRKL